MEAKTALYKIKQTAPSATLEDAEFFLALCADAGLLPFEEMHCIITDYRKKDGTQVHTVSVKRHYSVSHRWARQNGGYTVRVDKPSRRGDDYVHDVSIVSNNDYASVSRLASALGWDTKTIEAELQKFAVLGQGIVTGQEASRARSETGLTPEKKARKRALEAAEKAMFGTEPGMSRDLYAAIAAGPSRAAITDASAALYGRALPAPVEDVDGELVERATVPAEPVTGELEACGTSDVTAESIKRKLAYVAQGNQEQETNDKRRGLFCSKLEQCFDGNTEEKEDARRLVTWFLFDAAEGSSKALTEGQTRAWLAEYVAPAIEGDKYPLASYAKADMVLVYRAALIATGQESLPGIE